MITNNSFINGITHREMRAKLLNDFTDVHILNLFGRQNATGDENVFDINSIGVSISLLVKNTKTNRNLVSYSSCNGKREGKFKTLLDSDCYRINKNEINPASFDDELLKTRWGKRFPYFKFFTPIKDKCIELIKDYGDFWGLYQIFKVLSSAMETDRDETVIDLDSDALIKRMNRAFTGNYDADFIKTYRIHNSSSYRFEDKLKRMSYDDNAVQICQYRPFDFRHVYYIKGFTSRPGFETMQHFLYCKNLGLSVSRQVINDTWAHIFLTSILTERCLVSTESKECTYVAPLYLYNETTNGFWPEITDKKPNFSKEFNEYISGKYSIKPTPEEILGYIYAILYCPSYRDTYLELLKIDFPRIPFPKDYDFFNQLADLGKELVDLHIMNKKSYGEYKQVDENSPALVGNIFYDSKNSEIILDNNKPKNEQVRIGKVPQYIWDFQIGGYQVIKTWLIGSNRGGKNLGRKGRVIEIGELCQILNALTETDRVMKEIDPIFKAMMKYKPIV
jgi:predicted helicase